MNCIIVDDEPLAIDLIEDFITQIPFLKLLEKCKNAFETEMYVYYATNEYNFEKLENPPEFEPTRCADCNCIISLGEDAYTVNGNEYLCEHCYPLIRPS